PTDGSKVAEQCAEMPRRGKHLGQQEDGPGELERFRPFDLRDKATEVLLHRFRPRALPAPSGARSENWGTWLQNSSAQTVSSRHQPIARGSPRGRRPGWWR